MKQPSNSKPRVWFDSQDFDLELAARAYDEKGLVILDILPSQALHLFEILEQRIDDANCVTDFTMTSDGFVYLLRDSERFDHESALNQVHREVASKATQ